MVDENTPPVPTPPKLLDQVRDKIRVKHYSIRIETQYRTYGLIREGRREPAFYSPGEDPAVIY